MGSNSEKLAGNIGVEMSISYKRKLHNGWYEPVHDRSMSTTRFYEMSLFRWVLSYNIYRRFSHQNANADGCSPFSIKSP